jgi:hypothetical protein
MKKVLLILIAGALIVSCNKQGPVEEEISDGWNGYYNYYLKYKSTGETTQHTVWAHAARNKLANGEDVGEVVYEMDYCTDPSSPYYNEECFHVIFTIENGWEMTESHMYCGNLHKMPMRKQDRDAILYEIDTLIHPKIGLFHSAAVHDPAVTTYEYWWPCDSLPPGDDGNGNGAVRFVVASHCVVVKPGENETAWAHGNKPFNDRSWGWYDEISYDWNHDPGEGPYKIIYGIEMGDAYSLIINRYDLTNHDIETVDVEHVPTAGPYDCAAFDGNDEILFVDVSTNDLYSIDLTDNTDPDPLGSLTGDPAGGTFYDGKYYYVDNSTMTIYEVSFLPNGEMDTEIDLAVIPDASNITTVNDLAVSSYGTTLYIVGYTGTDVYLVEFDMANQTFSPSHYFSQLNTTVQIAFAENDLYFTQTANYATYLYYLQSDYTLSAGVVIHDDPGPRDHRDLTGGFTVY